MMTDDNIPTHNSASTNECSSPFFVHWKMCSRPKPIYFDSISFQYETLSWADNHTTHNSTTGAHWALSMVDSCMVGGHCTAKLNGCIVLHRANQISRVKPRLNVEFAHTTAAQQQPTKSNFYSQVISEVYSYFHGNFTAVLVARCRWKSIFAQITWSLVGRSEKEFSVFN